MAAPVSSLTNATVCHEGHTTSSRYKWKSPVQNAIIKSNVKYVTLGIMKIYQCYTFAWNFNAIKLFRPFGGLRLPTKRQPQKCSNSRLVWFPFSGDFLTVDVETTIKKSSSRLFPESVWRKNSRVLRLKRWNYPSLRLKFCGIPMKLTSNA